MPDKPLSNECRNPGRGDCWTCPGCYGDLGNVGENTITCEECGNTVECSLVYEPVCRSRIVTE